jgi:purine-binding chemotaxis protein CheW
MNASIGHSEAPQRYLVCAVADLRLAIAIEHVTRVIQAVEVSPLAGGHAAVSGFVNLRGDLVPVVDLRRRLGLEQREIGLSDQFVLVQRGVWRWFLIADGVVGVVELSEGRFVARDRAAALADCRAGELHFAEGVISVLDMSRLVSVEEAEQVRGALAGIAVE